MSAFPQISNTLYGLDKGSAFLTPVKNYGLPLEPIDIGDVEVNYTLDRTYTERYSNKSRSRLLAYRRLDQTTFKYSIKLFQESAVGRILKNVASLTGVQQEAVEDAVIPGRNGMRKGQVIILPHVGIKNVAMTIANAAANFDTDFYVHGPSGIIYARRDIVGAIAGTYDAIEFEIQRQKIAEHEEVQFSLTIVNDAPNDVRGSRKTLPLLGFSPTESIGVITGGTGADDGGFTVEGLVYDGGDGFGTDDILPSQEDIDGIVIP